MKRRTRTRTRLSPAIAAMAMMFALLPAGPAAAHPGPVTFAGQGTATLDAGIGAPCGPGNPNIHNGSFVGSASGTHNGQPFVDASISADYLYCNASTIAGTAEGVFVIQGHQCSFTWVRSGATAEIEFTGCNGSATAVFIPTHSPVTALVVVEGTLFSEAGDPAPACSDGVDNDGDGRTDYPNDPGCSDPIDTTEEGPPPACSDGVDNDGDGRTDYPNDPGCSDASDTTEEDDGCIPTPPGVVVCLIPDSDRVRFEQPVGAVEFQPAGSHHVLGYVAGYQFTVPGPTGDIDVTVPCVVLEIDGARQDPCLQAGGQPPPDGTPPLLTLVDQTVPGIGPAPPVTTVRICDAELIATVLGGQGVNSAPVLALC